jgi:benzodiazapine receptor
MTEPQVAVPAGTPPVGSKYPALVAFVVLCFAAATIGRFFPPDHWYASLNRPSYAPPNWVFGPVWTILYLMMAVSGWLVWKSHVSASKPRALTMFGVQLLLNAAWSAIFFGWHQPGWALLEMGLLWLALVATIVLFKRHSATAAMLLVPYLAWVSFAAVLNYGFWSLN